MDENRILRAKRSDIDTPRDAAQLFGTTLNDFPDSDSEALDEIYSLFREATHIAHPDRGGTAESFNAIKDARNTLEEWVEGGMPTLGTVTGKESETKGPATWGKSHARRSEQLKQTIEAVKLALLEQSMGKDLSEYSTLGEARADSAVTAQDINVLENRLSKVYGKDAELDIVAEVIASLVMSGSINLGDVDRFADESGAFGRGGGGAFGGGGGGAFGRRRRNGPFG